MTSDYTPQLRELMAAAKIPSFRALAVQIGVSEKTLRRLRRGDIAQMRLEVLLKLSAVLEVSLTDLAATFSDAAPRPFVEAEDPLAAQLEILRQEYEQLQRQLQAAEVEFQATALAAIESWLIQWPTAAHAAQTNAAIPASRLLPLMRPLEALLQDWGVEAIAPVGSETPFDPHRHQLMTGAAEPGDLVRVRYTGYLHQGKLLCRAKVSPVEGKGEGGKG